MLRSTNEGFKVGADVAVIHHSGFGDSRISKRRIAKVRKDGKFFLELKDAAGAEMVGEQMWTPDHLGSPRASKSGGSSYDRERIELWTAEHDEVLLMRRRKHFAQSQKNRLEEFLKTLDMRSKEDQDKLLAVVAELSNRGWLPVPKETES
jgi:hypothetical protein